MTFYGDDLEKMPAIVFFKSRNCHSDSFEAKKPPGTETKARTVETGNWTCFLEIQYDVFKTCLIMFM